LERSVLDQGEGSWEEKDRLGGRGFECPEGSSLKKKKKKKKKKKREKGGNKEKKRRKLQRSALIKDIKKKRRLASIEKKISRKQGIYLGNN